MARTQQSKLATSMVFLDTHIVCWLYAGETKLISAKALQAIENNALLVSPMVDLELQYLYEIERISLNANEILNALRIDIGLQVADDSFQEIITCSKPLHWTRDPFDRVIVGHAIHKKIPLITRDNTIQQYFEMAIW
jgi:PIN domain nuclease of toxin-antitoxin system